jgi:type II secretory pathway predicted ATPase ExeA
MYRKRFGLTAHPLPKDAQGKTFCEHGPGFSRLARAFAQLLEDPGLGVLTGEAGVGKTAALRHLCHRLPKPDYRVIYLCDTAVSPLDLYRTLASELGIRPSHRRAQLWADIKKTLVHMRDEMRVDGDPNPRIVGESRSFPPDFFAGVLEIPGGGVSVRI